MGPVQLELRCPKNVAGITIDPKPDWSFDDLLSELNSLESELNAVSSVPRSFPKVNSMREIAPVGRGYRRKKAFVMRVTEDELDDFGGDGEREKETVDLALLPGSRYDCHDVHLNLHGAVLSGSDDSQDEPGPEVQGSLMEKVGVVEVTLHELTHHNQLGIQEEIRNKISVLEAELLFENNKLASALAQVEKNAVVRRETDRKLDMQYQRKIAEALDNHLTAVQRDHEHRSQIEEKRIRDDAALEEARRKEKALQEEKFYQQKARAEEEARIEAARRVDEARKAALEAERRAGNEAAEKMTKESPVEAPSTAKVATMAVQNVQSNSSGSDGQKKVQSRGKILRASENALNLEERRLQKYKDVEEKNQALISSSNKDFSSYQRRIALQIKQMTGLIDNVRAKANELVRIFNDPLCPQSISMIMFAKKVIHIFENCNENRSFFACGYLIVLISAQVPHVMDLMLAEFHRACIYTVPKHIVYTQSAFETEEVYLKAIGYQKVDGKIEATDRFLQRMRSCMKLYGALVQTQIDGVQNKHGLEEGWAWLARFLNSLPAGYYPAVALVTFLEMAGFALHGKYKSQFRKLLKAIAQYYLNALKAKGGDPKVDSLITELQEYVVTRKFLVEPTGRRLHGSTISRVLVPE